VAVALLAHAGLTDRVVPVYDYSQNFLCAMAAKGKHINMLLLDHVKTLYKSDLELALSLDVLSDGCVVIGDNILFPGAPDFKEFVLNGPRFKTVVHSTTVEYSEDTADEVTVSIYDTHRTGSRHQAPCSPSTVAPGARLPRDQALKLKGLSLFEATVGAYRLPASTCSVACVPSGATTTEHGRHLFTVLYFCAKYEARERALWRAAAGRDSAVWPPTTELYPAAVLYLLVVERFDDSERW
jgi:hypothetical protein